MQVKKKSRNEFSIVFDDLEVETLESIDEVFSIPPVQVIKSAVEMSIKTADQRITKFHKDIELGND